jgi:Ca2+-binding EF-hand superfamily protein
MDLFDLADKDQDGVITADALGAVLSTRCRSKPNTVKDVYSLIDIEKNGWFTTTDLERFMNQITEADSPEDSAIRTVVNRYKKHLTKAIQKR